MKVHLIVAQGKNEGHVLPVTVRQFVIGRHRECQLRAGSTTVSELHCAILLRGRKVFATDLGSKNGTFVNGERVEGRRQLRNEDCLKVGRLVFLVWLENEQLDDSDFALRPLRRKGTSPDESAAGSMLLRSPEADEPPDLLGLADDSKCGSTVLFTPDASVRRHGKEAAEADPARPPDEPAAMRTMPVEARHILRRYRRRTGMSTSQ
jgi:predicted component of type VI protein secretion system